MLLITDRWAARYSINTESNQINSIRDAESLKKTDLMKTNSIQSDMGKPLFDSKSHMVVGSGMKRGP